jgi:hypothetical protein
MFAGCSPARVQLHPCTGHGYSGITKSGKPLISSRFEILTETLIQQGLQETNTMPTDHSLLNYYDQDFAEAANAYGQRLESLSLSEKSQLIVAIGDWVCHCSEVYEQDRNSFYEHIEGIDPFNDHECDAAEMVKKYLDFIEPIPAIQLAIALGWQIIEGVYYRDEDAVYEGFLADWGDELQTEGASLVARCQEALR